MFAASIIVAKPTWLAGRNYSIRRAAQAAALPSGKQLRPRVESGREWPLGVGRPRAPSGHAGQLCPSSIAGPTSCNNNNNNTNNSNRFLL